MKLRPIFNIMKQIYSKENELYKLAKRLHDRRGRVKESSFLIEGPKLIAEAIDSGVNLRYLFYSDSVDIDVIPANNRVIPAKAGISNEKSKACHAELVSASLTSVSSTEILKQVQDDKFFGSAVVDRVLFSEMVETVNSQGVLAIADLPSSVDVSSGVVEGASYIVLDRIQDPGNVGTLLRTAYAAGFDAAIVVKGSADCYSGKVIRAAAGAVFRLPLLYAETAEDVVSALAANHVKIFAADADGGSDLFDTDIRGSVALVIGNEGGGLSEEFAESNLLSIPMREDAESLNAAIAAAVLMFEKRRQEAHK
jgi:TrmH family RNA methyltransferase